MPAQPNLTADLLSDTFSLGSWPFPTQSPARNDACWGLLPQISLNLAPLFFRDQSI